MDERSNEIFQDRFTVEVGVGLAGLQEAMSSAVAWAA